MDGHQNMIIHTDGLLIKLHHTEDILEGTQANKRHHLEAIFVLILNLFKGINKRSSKSLIQTLRT